MVKYVIKIVLLDFLKCKYWLQLFKRMIKSQNLTSNLNELLNSINIIFNSDFNSILINYYKDGNDYIGNHSDDEKCLDKIGVSLSYGSIRKFRIKDKITKKT